jgi:hypothetical protein
MNNSYFEQEWQLDFRLAYNHHQARTTSAPGGMNTMKTIVMLLLVIAMPVASQAQQPTLDLQGPSDVAIVKFTWGKEFLPGWENNQFAHTIETPDARRERLENERRIQQARNVGNKAELGKRENAAKMLEDAKLSKGSKNMERPRDGYRYEVQIRNTGEKTIKLIDWDYIFLDPDMLKEVARHQFTSDDTVKPGKSKKISVFYLHPPVKTVSVEMLSKKNMAKFKEQVVLMRIQYSDGSVWQRP